MDVNYSGSWDVRWSELAAWTARSMPVSAAMAMAFALLMAGCGDDPYRGGSCSDFTGFTAPIVPVAEVSRVIPLGELNPPEDVAPAVAGGFGFNVPYVDISAPGDVVITSIEATEYLVSPGRQGVTDFGLVMFACDDIKFRIEHIVTLDPSIADELGTGHCEVNVGAEETTEDCRYNVDIRLVAGDPIGVTGTYQNGVAVGLDFSAVDLSYDIPWLNPDRIGDVEDYNHGICVYTTFIPSIANAYLDLAASGLTPLVRPDRCGTVEIDIDGTPQGLWVREDNPVTLTDDLLQDAPNFLTLSPGVADPSTSQHVSSGVAALGTDLATTTKEVSGRVNLDFGLVPDDGTLHCYEGQTPQGNDKAYFVALDGAGVLTVESTAFPCSGMSPVTWAFTGAAIRFVR